MSKEEQKNYAKNVQVLFTPKAVINKITMDKYIDYFVAKVNFIGAWFCSSALSRIICLRLYQRFEWTHELLFIDFDELKI